MTTLADEFAGTSGGTSAPAISGTIADSFHGMASAPKPTIADAFVSQSPSGNVSAPKPSDVYEDAAGHTIFTEKPTVRESPDATQQTTAQTIGNSLGRGITKAAVELGRGVRETVNKVPVLGKVMTALPTAALNYAQGNNLTEDPFNQANYRIEKQFPIAENHPTLSGVVEGVANMAPMTAAGLAHPGLGAAAGGAQGIGSAINEGEQKGYTPTQTAGVALARGGLNAALGAIPGGKVAGGVLKSTLTKGAEIAALNTIGFPLVEATVKDKLGIQSDTAWDAIKNAATSGEQWAITLLMTALHAGHATINERANNASNVRETSGQVRENAPAQGGEVQSGKNLSGKPQEAPVYAAPIKPAQGGIDQLDGAPVRNWANESQTNIERSKAVSERIADEKASREDLLRPAANQPVRENPHGRLTLNADGETVTDAEGKIWKSDGDNGWLPVFAEPKAESTPLPVETSTPPAVSGEAKPSMNVATERQEGQNLEQKSGNQETELNKNSSDSLPSPTKAVTYARFEYGKKLTDEQRKDVLRGVGDSYKDLKAPKVLKGQNRDGDPIYGYDYNPEYMHTSDITGRKIRNYIRLPDGKIAHPSELYPEITQSHIDRAISEEKYRARNKEYSESQKESRVVGTKSEANIKYSETKRPLENSYFAQNDDGKIVRVDGGDSSDVAYFERKGFKKLEQIAPPISASAEKFGPGAANEGDTTAFRPETTGHETVPESAPRASGSPLSREGQEAASASKELGLAQEGTGGFIGKAKEFGRNISDSWKRYSQKSFPSLTRASDKLGEAAASLISTKESAHARGEYFSALVRDAAIEAKINPKELDRKLGAVLVEDQLRGIRQKFIDAKDAESAAKVKTIIGGEDSPFKTEKDYQDALNDKNVQAALAIHRQFVEPTLEENYRASAKIDPSQEIPARGRDTNSHMSLKAILDDAATDYKSTDLKAGGNIRNTLEKHSPLEREARGTAKKYELSYSELVKNALEKGQLPANQARLYKAAVDSGVAVYGKPGENPTIDGKPTVAFDTIRKTLVSKSGAFSQNEKLYVRKDIAKEFRNALKVDAPDYSESIKMANNVQTQIALASGVEAISHAANHFGVLFKSPIKGEHLPTVVANIPGVKIVGILDSVGTNAYKMLMKKTDTLRQLSELADIGALKPMYENEPPKTMAGKIATAPMRGMSKAIELMATSARLSLMQGFDMLADRGIVENTPTAKRDFVNQVGQYHKEAQGSIVRILRNTGLSPFATAGTTFHSGALRTAMLDPGVKATSARNAALLRANMVAQFTGTLAMVAVANYMRTGQLQPKGTPWGSLYVGKTEDDKPKYLDVADIIGLKRTARAVGLDAMIEGARNSATPTQVADKAFKQASGAAVSPYAGPAITAGITAISGYSPHGMMDVAGRAGPDESQAVRNVTAAALKSNPTVGTLLEANERGDSKADMFAQQFGKFAPRTGKNHDTVPNSQAESLMREIMQKKTSGIFTKEQEQRHKDMADIYREAKGGNLERYKQLPHNDQVQIADRVNLSPLEYGLKHGSLTPNEAMMVFDKANDYEKRAIIEKVAGKIANSHERGGIDDGTFNAYVSRLRKEAARIGYGK